MAPEWFFIGGFIPVTTKLKDTDVAAQNILLDI